MGEEATLRELATITDPDELRRLVHAWYDTAAFHARNEEFYRGIVQRTGEALGRECYRQDDGNYVDEVLALRVPEVAREIVQRHGPIVPALPTFTSAFAIGDRVRVIRHSDLNPGRRDYTGTVRVVLFGDGKVNYGVDPDWLPSPGGYVTVDSAFVHPVESPPAAPTYSGIPIVESASMPADGVAFVGVDPATKSPPHDIEARLSALEATMAEVWAALELSARKMEGWK